MSLVWRILLLALLLNALTVGEARDDVVGGDVLLAHRVILRRSAWEDAKKQHFGFWQFFGQDAKDRFDTFGGLLRAAGVNGAVVLDRRPSLMPGVVGADHEDDELRFQAVKVAIL